MRPCQPDVRPPFSRPRPLRVLAVAIAALIACPAIASATAWQSAPDGARRAGVASAASLPSGEAMPVGNLDGWRQTFTDDFTTDVALGSFPSAVSGKWGAYPSPWKDTSKYGT